MSGESDVTATHECTQNGNLYCHQKQDKKGGRQK